MQRDSDCGHADTHVTAAPQVSAVCELTGLPYSAAAAALQRVRCALPIYARRRDIQETVCQHRVTLLVGETGSGKTTQVPRFLAELPAGRLHGSMHGSGCSTAAAAAAATTSSAGAVVVACTQPRRLAAVSVATRVAAEADVPLGREVGYHVRFACAASAQTRVLYLTDGMLLRQAAAGGAAAAAAASASSSGTLATTTIDVAATLPGYDVVVVDEAHERAVDTDVVLGLLKRLLPLRPQLRVVVMSATLDVDALRRFLPHAPLLQVSGRMHEVAVRYMPRPVSDYVEAAVAVAVQLHTQQPAGDVLVFLTGEAEIERAVATTRRRLTECGCDCSSSSAAAAVVAGGVVDDEDDDDCPACAAKSNSNKRNNGVGDKRARDDDDDDKRHARNATSVPLCKPTRAVVLPLYGSLSLPAQQRVFATYGRHTRKIIFATNIAETSLTIDGVVYVVDCGYEKQTLYHATARVDYLLPAVISKAAAEQRRGRAGRTRPGICYRLYTHDEYTRLFPAHSHAAMLRSNVVNTVLTLLQLGIDNVCSFDMLDAPPHDSLEDAFYQLVYLGAVDGDTLRLTPLGQQMATLPVDVCLARMLLLSGRHGCGGDVAVLAAMLEATGGGGGGVFVRPQGRGAEAAAARARFAHADGDHVTLFLVFHAYYRHTLAVSSSGGGVEFCRDHCLRHQTLQQAVLVYTQLRRVMAQCGIAATSRYDAEQHTVDTIALRRALLEGFFLQVAHYTATSTSTTTTVKGTATATATRAGTMTSQVRGGASDNASNSGDDDGCCYYTVREGAPVRLHWQSVLHTRLRMHGAATMPWVVYDRLAVQSVEEGSYMRCVSPVDVAWLLDVSAFYRQADEVANADTVLALRAAAAAAADDKKTRRDEPTRCV